MKKKVLFIVVLIILVISEISMVYADMIVPKHIEYSKSEILEKFNEYIQIPLKEIITILFILFLVTGLVLLAFRFFDIKDKNKIKEKNNLLKNVFFVINIVLSLISVYMIKLIGSFRIMSVIGDVDDMIHFFMKKAIVFYAIIMIFFSVISIMTKNKKIIYTITIGLTIIILIAYFIAYNNLEVLSV